MDPLREVVRGPGVVQLEKPRQQRRRRALRVDELPCRRRRPPEAKPSGLRCLIPDSIIQFGELET